MSGSELSTEAEGEADNIDARFDNLQYHAKAKFNN